MRTLGNEWWLPLAATGAVLSGLSGALHLMWGDFVIGGGLLALSVVLLRWPRSI